MILLSESPVRSKESDHVESLDRGLSVLRSLSVNDRPVSVTELAESIGITRTAARRFALTLEHLGYIGRDAAGFTLRPAVLQIGDSYLRSKELVGLAHPYLASLVQAVGETASLTVLHSRRVMYVDRVAAERVITANIVVGTSVPAHATATGHVLLSGLDEEGLREYLEWLGDAPNPEGLKADVERTKLQIAATTQKGWAFADQELTPGIVSIAVPVHGAEGDIVAALNISAHASRADRQSLEGTVLPLLQEAARSIESELKDSGTAHPTPMEQNDGLRRSAESPLTTIPRPKDAVQSLDRGLAILISFDEAHSTMNLSEVAARCDLSRSATRRFLRTLNSLGYIRASGRRFELTPEVLALGYSYLAKLSMADIVKPHIETLSRSLGATVSVGVLDGTDVRYVGRVAAPSALAVSIRIGSRVPANRTAMGHVLLGALPAEKLRHYSAATESAQDAIRLNGPTRTDLEDALARSRAAGWSYVDQLLEVGVRAIAIPLHNRRNEVVAALSASVHDASIQEEDMVRDFLPRMRETAAVMTYEFRNGIAA